MSKEQQELWKDVEGLLGDDNVQNKHSANAGDGPKHIALLHAMELMGERLQLVIETHSGGGVYRVPADRFCLNIPAGSTLARHQRQANLPHGPTGQAHYSASGDQILTHMPSTCRYAAFDQKVPARQRLAALARYRGREDSFDSYGDFRGEGGETSLTDVVARCNPTRTLAMVDPFHVADWVGASAVLPAGVASLWFAAIPEPRQPRTGRPLPDPWRGEPQRRHIRWTWKGDTTPNQPSRHRFILVAAMPTREETHALWSVLLEEHEAMARAMGPSYHYRGELTLNG